MNDFEKKMLDFNFALLNINERFGEDFTKEEITKIGVGGGCVFFQIDEATFYNYEDNESVDWVYALFLDSYCGEIICEYKASDFNWSKKAIQKLGTSLNKSYG